MANIPQASHCFFGDSNTSAHAFSASDSSGMGGIIRFVDYSKFTTRDQMTDGTQGRYGSTAEYIHRTKARIGGGTVRQPLEG